MLYLQYVCCVCACHICMYFIFDQQPHPLRQVFCRFEEGVGIKPIWPVTGDQYQFDSASDLGPDAFRTTSLRSRALALQLLGVPKSRVWPWRICLCYYICLIEYIDCSVCHGRREATQSLRIICAAQSTKDWREPFSSVLVSWKHRGPLPGPNPVVVLRKAGAVAVAVALLLLVFKTRNEYIYIDIHAHKTARITVETSRQVEARKQRLWVGEHGIVCFFPQFLTKLCLSSLTHGHAQVFFEVLSLDVEMLSVSCVTTMSPPAVFASRSLLIPFLMLPALHWSE